MLDDTARLDSSDIFDMPVGFFVKAKLAKGVSLLFLLTECTKIIPLFIETLRL